MIPAPGMRSARVTDEDVEAGGDPRERASLLGSRGVAKQRAKAAQHGAGWHLALLGFQT